MKKIMILCCVLGMSGNVFSAPMITGVTFDGTWHSLAGDMTQTAPDTWELTSPMTFTDTTGSVTFKELKLDSDPSIAYSVSVTSLSATPTTFSFSYSLPIIPIVGPTIVTSTFGGGVTNIDPDNGVTFAPVSGAIQQSFIDGVDAGVDLGTTTLSFSGVPQTQSFSAAAGPIAGPNGAASTIKITTSFTLSGVGNQASLTGAFNVVAAPEPSTYALLIIGISLFLLGARRKSISSNL